MAVQAPWSRVAKHSKRITVPRYEVVVRKSWVRLGAKAKRLMNRFFFFNLEYWLWQVTAFMDEGNQTSLLRSTSVVLRELSSFVLWLLCYSDILSNDTKRGSSLDRFWSHCRNLTVLGVEIGHQLHLDFTWPPLADDALAAFSDPICWDSLRNQRHFSLFLASVWALPQFLPFLFCTLN